MKAILTILILSMSISLAHSQTDKEHITNTLNNYIEGSSYNKTDLIIKAFANNATLYLTNREGVFNTYTPTQYAGFFKNRQRGEFNGRVGTILEIEIEKDIATARVEIAIAERKSRYIDIFLLKNIEGIGWRIISKTATEVDYPGYAGRDRKLDNFTLQRLLVLNDAGEILVEQGDISTEDGKISWFPFSSYSNQRLSVKEAMDSLALSHGIKITQPQLKAYTTYKFSYHEQVSHRSYYVAKYASGTIKPSTDGVVRKWVPIEEVLPNIPVEAIRLTAQQVLKYPETVWGGSFLISENGEQHDTTVLEEFYPLFRSKL